MVGDDRNSFGEAPLEANIQLREVIEGDLTIFFKQQLDPTANYLAAFTREDPTDWDAFNAHWKRIIDDEEITIKTILFRNQVAGHVLTYVQSGEREVSYWLGREFWGKGIATKALSMFLTEFQERPLYARAAEDNLASLRVLEKCGFIVSGYDKGFANARGEEIEEVVMILT